MGKLSQRNGKRFEERLCEYFSKKGYYVIYNEKGVTGSQPTDIVIIKNNIATLIEAKNLDNTTGRFPLNRVEMNQHLAYKKYRSCKNTNFVLAINWNDGVYIIDFGLIQFYKNSIDLKALEPNFRWEEIL